MSGADTHRTLLLTLATLLSGVTAHAQGQSELEHVPPEPPKSHVHAMPYDEMAEMMGMDDRMPFGKYMADRLEWQESSGDSSLAWEVAAWYGGDFNKVWFESEGERASGTTQESRTEISWDRIISSWWSLRLGARHDGGIGPARDWAAIGIAGLAPGMYEIEAGFYVGENGRTALRFAADKDYLLTQRLVLQPEVELAAYGRDDAERLIGSGLSDLKLGLRLRYELHRQFAPYIGVRWVGHFGESADFREAAGQDDAELLWLAGMRAWF